MTPDPKDKHDAGWFGRCAIVEMTSDDGRPALAYEFARQAGHLALDYLEPQRKYAR